MTNTLRPDKTEGPKIALPPSAEDNFQTKDFIFISFICQEQLEKVAQDKSC